MYPWSIPVDSGREPSFWYRTLRERERAGKKRSLGGCRHRSTLVNNKRTRGMELLDRHGHNSSQRLKKRRNSKTDEEAKENR